MKSVIDIIHDADHGSDDFITTLAILARPERLRLLGISTCHGNVPAKRSARNALIACHLAGRDDIDVYVGATRPMKGISPVGDNAHGEDGLGGAQFAISPKMPRTRDARKWMTATIRNANKPITIIATGALTNVAEVLSNTEGLNKNIRALYIMGGAFGHPGGNITKHAEFNFYLDPYAADFVLSVPALERVLVPLDTTHAFAVSSDVLASLRKNIQSRYQDEILKVIRAAEDIDQRKFGSEGAYLHDVHTVNCLLHPEAYEFTSTGVSVETRSSPQFGKSRFTDKQPTTKVAVGLSGRTGFQRFLLNSFSAILS